MKQKAIIKILDEVNLKFENINSDHRRQMVKMVEYKRGHAFHTMAYKLGRWDGTVSLCNTGGLTYLHLLPKFYSYLDQYYTFDVEDKRKSYDINFDKIDENVFGETVWPSNHPYAGETIVLRDYQVEAVNRFFENLNCTQQLCTSAGKTIMMAALCFKTQDFGRTLTIVPNRDLVTQTAEDYENTSLDVGVFFGTKKQLGHKHTICTWQTISALMKKVKAKDTEAINQLEEIKKDLICVIVDEAHNGKSDEMKSMLSGIFSFVPIRWGLTGTLPKDPYDEMLIQCLIGPKVGEIRSHQLQDKGVLSTCNINIIQTKEKHKYNFETYDEEKTFVSKDRKRLAYFAKLIDEMATKDGNTLVLVDRKETGIRLKEFLPEDAAWINGNTKSKDRKEEYSSIQFSDQRIIVATYGVAAVGINIPRLYNCVFFDPGKSFVRVMQSIGRGLRKAKDKDHVEIYDICSDLKYSNRHLTSRKKYYAEEKFPYNIKKVDL